MKKLLVITSLFAISVVASSYACLSDETYDAVRLLATLSNMDRFVSQYAVKDTSNKSDLAFYKRLQNNLGKTESSLADMFGITAPLNNADYDKLILLADLSRLHMFVKNHALKDTSDKTKQALYTSLSKMLHERGQELSDSLGVEWA